MIYLWDIFTEICPAHLPVQRTVDFNVAAYAWASAVGETLSRSELMMLKRLYRMMCDREDNPLPPMVEATDDALKDLFAVLASQKKK